MRDENKQVLKKQALLLEKFQQGEELSSAQIREVMECNSPQTVLNYINKLKKQGYPIEKKERSGKTYYFLAKSDVLSYQPITLDILRKYSIIQTLQQSSATIDTVETLVKKLTAGKDKSAIGIGKSSLRKLIHELIEEGEIVLDQKDMQMDSYRVTAQRIPFVLSLNDNELQRLEAELCHISPGNAYYESLRSLHHKVSLLLGNIPDDTTPYFDNYIFYGKKYESFYDLFRKLSAKFPAKFERHVLRIEYQTNSKGIKTIDLALKLLIYSAEKNKLYLWGQPTTAMTPQGLPTFDIFIELNQIKQVGLIAETHNLFQSPKYYDAFQTMFDISTEKGVHVLVEFYKTGDDVTRIKNELNHLKNHRPNAKIEEQDDKILYSDIISGLPDFAKYLRQFGASVRVLEPMSLKQELAHSIQKSLKQYEEVRYVK